MVPKFNQNRKNNNKFCCFIKINFVIFFLNVIWTITLNTTITNMDIYHVNFVFCFYFGKYYNALQHNVELFVHKRKWRIRWWLKLEKSRGTIRANWWYQVHKKRTLKWLLIWFQRNVNRYNNNIIKMKIINKQAKHFPVIKTKKVNYMIKRSPEM